MPAKRRENAASDVADSSPISTTTWNVTGRSEADAAIRVVVPSMTFAFRSLSTRLCAALGDRFALRAPFGGGGGARRHGGILSRCHARRRVRHSEDIRAILGDEEPRAGVIVSEDRETFVARIEPRPLPGYWDDRQLRVFPRKTKRVHPTGLLPVLWTPAAQLQQSEPSAGWGAFFDAN